MITRTGRALLVVLIVICSTTAICSWVSAAQKPTPLVFETSDLEKAFIPVKAENCREVKAAPDRSAATLSKPFNPARACHFSSVRVIVPDPEVVEVLSDIAPQVETPEDPHRKVKLRSGDRFFSSQDLSYLGAPLWECFAQMKGLTYQGPCIWLTNYNPDLHKELKIISQGGPQDVWYQIRDQDQNPVGWCLGDWETGGG